MPKVIMVQGTSSNVGKSVLTAALCRIFKQDGYKVAPFKAQNMALNAFVTPEGGEIGRAQAVQAAAAGIAPSVHMNPVLIKPEADSRAQIIVQGKVYATTSARQYYDHTTYLMGKVRQSFEILAADYDVIVIEGAGSPAEINLKAREIANMRIAREFMVPVVLVGDIDRGGVYASLVGTLELLDEDERKYVKGFIINKFRGDESLIADANEFLEKRTLLPVLGIVPYFRDILLPQEDSVYLDERVNNSIETDLDIVIIRLPRISNYDDFDSLETDGARVRYVSRPDEMGNPDLIILPGTKSTVPDLLAIRSSGIADAVTQKARSGTPVVGVCGGFQMLGDQIFDPYHVESDLDVMPGLGLLKVNTTFEQVKSTTQVKGEIKANHGLLLGLTGEIIAGYEIHMGRTSVPRGQELCHITETLEGAKYPDGMVSENGDIFGCYIHGIFESIGFRRGLLNSLRRRKGLTERAYTSAIDKDSHYNALAALVRKHLDMPAVYRILEKGIQA